MMAFCSQSCLMPDESTTVTGGDSQCALCKHSSDNTVRQHRWTVQWTKLWRSQHAWAITVLVVFPCFQGFLGQVWCAIPCFSLIHLFFLKVEQTHSILWARICPHWLSEIRWLWMSVPWQVVCKLVSLRGSQHYASAAYCIVSPLWLHWIKGVCMFRCNLPPALLAEWPRSFTCHCNNKGVELTLSKSQHRKLTLEKKILPTLEPGIKHATFKSRVWQTLMINICTNPVLILSDKTREWFSEHDCNIHPVSAIMWC